MLDVFLGNTGGSSWGISSIFGGGDKSAKENVASKQYAEPFHSVDSVEQSFSMIHLTEVCILRHIIIIIIIFLGISFHIHFVFVATYYLEAI
jgi:hypothetical protein